ncbi:MAG: hypothetical protein R6X12_05955 [bacterium]
MRTLLLLSVLAASGPAAPTARTIEAREPCPAGSVVRLAHRYGNIVARPVPGDTLQVAASARVDGRDSRQVGEFLAAIELSVARWADTVFVAVLYPELVEPSRDFSYEVDLRLGVPDGVRLDAAGSFGDIELHGITGGSSVSNRYGNASFRACRDVDVAVKHGDVRVEANTGRLGINCTYGNVFLDAVADRVDVDSRYGDVTGQQLAGDVTINNVLGSIETAGGQGRWRLVSRCGRVAARLDDSALARLDVVAQLARVRLLMPQVLPFRIEGRTESGEIGTAFPFQTRLAGDQHHLSGTRGRGGPRIAFTGAWSDFSIEPDSTGRPATDEGR